MSLKDFKNPWASVDSIWFNDELSKFKNVNVSVNDNKDTNSIEISDKADIVVVVDPGHGNTKGNTGSVYIKSYKHRVKGSDGKPKKDEDDNEIIIETEIDSLPDYVKKEITNSEESWVWATKRIYDQSKTERDLVWDVSLHLKDILIEAGYNCILTRSDKIIQGNDDRTKRIKVANDNNAHYFISIHADGSLNYEVSGSHSIYRSGSKSDYTNKQKQFATDIYKYYTIIKKVNSPRDRTNIQVLSPSQNKALRKALVELGFVTNTNDYDSMNSNKLQIAKQIAKGIELNISKIFYIVEKGVLLGYVFNGLLYKSREDAYQVFYNYIKLPAGVDAITRETILAPQARYEVKHSFIKPTIF